MRRLSEFSGRQLEAGTWVNSPEGLFLSEDEGNILEKQRYPVHQQKTSSKQIRQISCPIPDSLLYWQIKCGRYRPNRGRRAQVFPKDSPTILLMDPQRSAHNPYYRKAP